MPLPILIASLMRPSGETGVQTHFRTFERYLSGQGRQVTLLTPFSAPAALVYPLFAPRRLLDIVSPSSGVWWYRAGHAAALAGPLAKALKRFDRAVVYAQCPVSAGVALRKRRTSGQKVVMVVHFNLSQADEWAGKGALKPGGRGFESIRRFEADVLPRLDGIVYVSEFMRHALVERIPGLASVPAAVIPNFVADPGEQRSHPQEGDLITIGTLESRKNQEYALEIVAAAHKMGCPLRLTVVGDGPDRTRLPRRAADLGIAQAVRFEGFVPEAARRLPAHRACLHVARIENLPLTLIESLAYGVPVFATAVGGVPEVVDGGVTGQLLPLEAPEEAAGTIIEWLDDPGRMRAASHAARERFLERFETGCAASRLDAFLQEVGECVS